MTDEKLERNEVAVGGWYHGDWRRVYERGTGRREDDKLIGITASGEDAVKFCIAHNKYVTKDEFTQST